MSNYVKQLKDENRRLIALLEQHQINWQAPVDKDVESVEAPVSVVLSTEEKVTLFRKRFLGRNDVFPIRWQNAQGDRSGYSPACDNEWRAGVCEKPRIKCGDCEHRQLTRLTDETIYEHLAGKIVLGVYPLLTNNTCHFLAVDFDKFSWREDVQGFISACRDLKIPVATEISRSGNGAHVWIFFDSAISARMARQLGTALISHTCAITHQLDLSSYDRLFPNQDTLPNGGFGNLIALPLQKEARDRGCTVFVNDRLEVISDQWEFLSTLKRMQSHTIESIVQQISIDHHPLDVSFVDEQEHKEPWNRSLSLTELISGELPKAVDIVSSDRVYIEKAGVPQSLLNRLIRIAAFQNPEFYKAQAMRFSVWDKPRVIACADNYPNHIALPRGCLEPLQALLKTNNIKAVIRDERYVGKQFKTSFKGTLRLDQQVALDAVLDHDIGVLCARTAFGKTVTAAALIAHRQVNTLVLVHRSELQSQWIEQLNVFLELQSGDLGRVGGGKRKITGVIDVALVQSLSRQGKVDPVVEDYGQVIVDECHHVGAVSFEAIMKRVKAKYVVGLTATPIRRDGQQPIIFMQCGPIRHTVKHPVATELRMQVRALYRDQAIAVVDDAGIQEVFRKLIEDEARTEAIAASALQAYGQGKNVLVLTERTEHLKSLQAAMSTEMVFVLHGRISKKQRRETMVKLRALDPAQPRILLATGKLIGEGFDHSALDTLILAMPVSWKGTLQQYVGRLHRSHEGKHSVTVFDIVDRGHPALIRMWEKRQKGYRAMGYVID